MAANTDRFREDARELIEKLRKFELGALDDPVGHDTEQIREEVVAEFLQERYGK